MHYIKIKLFQNKCPLGQLSYESIWLYQKLEWLVISYQNNWATIKITSKTIARHSPSCELYLTSILLLEQLAHATTNSWPSSSSWINIVPNLELFQSMCNWNDRPQMGCFKMGVDERSWVWKNWDLLRWNLMLCFLNRSNIFHKCCMWFLGVKLKTMMLLI